MRAIYIEAIVNGVIQEELINLENVNRVIVKVNGVKKTWVQMKGESFTRVLTEQSFSDLVTAMLG